MIWLINKNKEMGVKLKLEEEKFIYNTKLITEKVSPHVLPKYHKDYEIIRVSNKESYCTLKNKKINVYRSLAVSELKVGEPAVRLIKSFKLRRFSLFKIYLNDFIFFSLNSNLRKLNYFIKVNKMFFVALLITGLYFLLNNIFEGKIVELIEKTKVFHFLWVFIVSFLTVKKIVELRLHFSNPEKKIYDIAEEKSQEKIEEYRKNVEYKKRSENSL
ncbi:hypothetical protein KUL113_57320 [Tenacibaculum sp. KUL113]|nr:hypothetical protein KUL113_57320 [Tenacibaculum sp. KUL113]